MPRPKAKPPKVRSRVAGDPASRGGVGGPQQLAEDIGQPPSRIIRRLIREALTGGPDYFNDGVSLISAGCIRELASIGRNLNQLSRAANQGRGGERGRCAAGD